MEKTFTEQNIEKKTQKFLPVLKEMAKAYLHNKYKKNIQNERMAEYCQCLAIDEKETPENNEKRKQVKDILYTEYNQDLDKSFHDYFIQNKENIIHKWFAYFDEYEKHFSRFRGKDVNILEIGVSHGGSTKMWKHYFSKNNAKVNIYGVDINPDCKKLEEEGIQIFIGSQEDREFLRQLKTQIPPVDILIDDGGHTMQQQIVTFEEMFDHVKDNGVYWVEDLHTSYWEEFGGGGGENSLLWITPKI